MASEASDRETAGHAWSRPLDPADKEGERPTIFLPSGKKYKGEWSRNKMNGARRTPPPRATFPPRRVVARNSRWR